MAEHLQTDWGTLSLTQAALHLLLEAALADAVSDMQAQDTRMPQHSATSIHVLWSCLQTDWGTHSLTQASRLLLKAALANPMNQRFSLLCGSSLPVRPPLFVYTQLIAENRTRFGVQQGHFIHAKHDQVSSLPAMLHAVPHIPRHCNCCR